MNAAVRTCYCGAAGPVEHSHYHIVWLLARDESAKGVVEITGYSARWVSEVTRRYNEGGTAALGDHRHKNPGRRFLLSKDERRELAEALESPAPDGGLWSGSKVAPGSRRRPARRLTLSGGWVYLRRLGYSLKGPRPHHWKANLPEEQEAFKKTSRPG